MGGGEVIQFAYARHGASFCSLLDDPLGAAVPRLEGRAVSTFSSGRVAKRHCGHGKLGRESGGYEYEGGGGVVVGAKVPLRMGGDADKRAGSAARASAGGRQAGRCNAEVGFAGGGSSFGAEIWSSG